jgi:hypothetical protein
MKCACILILKNNFSGLSFRKDILRYILLIRHSWVLEYEYWVRICLNLLNMDKQQKSVQCVVTPSPGYQEQQSLSSLIKLDQLQGARGLI